MEKDGRVIVHWETGHTSGAGMHRDPMIMETAVAQPQQGEEKNPRHAKRHTQICSSECSFRSKRNP